MNILSRLLAKKSASPIARYSLYPFEVSAEQPERLWLSYEWDDSFENLEWRLCVTLFLQEVEMLGHAVEKLPSPSFTPGEDFVEIEFLVAGVRTTFSSDYLLNVIHITAEDSRVIRSAWNDIGNKVGWYT